MNERLQKMVGERTLVLIKPDAVMRGLVGEIFQRFERTGLKTIACKMVFPTRKQLDGHFPKSEEWVQGMGEKTLQMCQEYDINPLEILGTDDSLAIGKKIKEWNYDYLMLGPVMAIVFEGIHAVDMVRKLIGHTLPYRAEPGTIRGDFSINAPDLASVVGSSCKNLVHASDTVQEAEREIFVWFSQDELIVWQRADGFIHFVQGEFTESQQATKETNIMQYAHLEQTLNRLRDAEPRNAAEHSYALAMLYRTAGNKDQAISFGRQTLVLLDMCPMETMEEYAALNVVIEGVPLPDFIHQNVVRDRLQPLEL